MTVQFADIAVYRAIKTRSVKKLVKRIERKQ